LFNLAQPQHPEVIKYFINTVNTLRGVRQDNNVGENVSMVEIIKTLGVDKNDLINCNKKTSTATARSLIRFKYPNPEPNFGLTNVDKSIIHAIIGKFNIVFILID
jgi:hypothetical protein